MAKRTFKEKTQHKLVYIGNFVPEHSTENHFKKTFESLGWEVKPVQESDIGVSISLDDFLKECEDCKFLLYTRTWARTGRLYGEILKKIKIPTVSFHLDLYLDISRGDNLENDTFFQSDFVFSADGGHQEEFKKMGINHYWSPPGVYDKECYLSKEIKKIYQKDVIFVGSYNYHREWMYRKELLNWLRDTYGERFKHFGDRICVRGDDLNSLYASAKVVVGDSLYSPYYWSDRVPETLGRGGFLLHPKVEGLGEQFKYGEHLVPYWYGDFKTLKMIIDYFIENDEEREKIRLAGHEWVKKHHTYKNRARLILNTLKKESVI